MQNGHLRTRLSRLLCATLSALVAGLALSATATAAPSLNWVALGDSYSSGTGLGPVTGDCDRDDYAYAPRAVRDVLSGNFDFELDFIACADTTTDGVLLDQVPQVEAHHDVATITVGGNNIGFGDKVRGCFFGFSCGPDVMSLSADTAEGPQSWDEVYNDLVTVYVSTRNRMNPNGHLYVMTYPIPFARQSTRRCSLLNATEQNAANALVTRLDDTIYWATRRANELLETVHGRPGNVHFVDWRTGERVDGGYTIPSGYAGAGQRFATYVSPDGLCNTSGRRPLINGFVGLLGSNRGNSFHPNSTGYWIGAEKVSQAIEAHH